MGTGFSAILIRLMPCEPMWELACPRWHRLGSPELPRYLHQYHCRSELAREKLTGAAFIQEARVIVEVFREQARSYKMGLSPLLHFKLLASKASRTQ